MSLKDSSVMPVIAVDDLERAAGFYSGKLGLEVERIPDDPSVALVRVGDDSLLLYRSSFPRGATTVASFIVHDVEGTVAELQGRGVVFEEYDQPGLKTVGGIATMGDLKSAWFKDSEGNVMAISLEQPQLARKAA